MFTNFHCHRCATQVHHACLVQEELHTLWRRLVLDSRSHHKKYVLIPLSLSPKYMNSCYFSRMFQDFSVSSFYRYLSLLASMFACPISFDVFLSSAEPKIFRLWSFTGTRNCTSTSTKTSVFDPHHDVLVFELVLHDSSFFVFRDIGEKWWKMCGFVLLLFFLFSNFPTFFQRPFHSCSIHGTRVPRLHQQLMIHVFIRGQKRLHAGIQNIGHRIGLERNQVRSKHGNLKLRFTT